MENCLCENCNSSLCNGKYICSENDYRVLDESDNLLKIIVENLVLFIAFQEKSQKKFQNY